LHNGIHFLLLITLFSSLVRASRRTRVSSPNGFLQEVPHGSAIDDLSWRSSALTISTPPSPIPVRSGIKNNRASRACTDEAQTSLPCPAPAQALNLKHIREIRDRATAQYTRLIWVARCQIPIHPILTGIAEYRSRLRAAIPGA
jgi:hypothetical protein